jgi:hypothetical protein
MWVCVCVPEAFIAFCLSHVCLCLCMCVCVCVKTVLEMVQRAQSTQGFGSRLRLKASVQGSGSRASLPSFLLKVSAHGFGSRQR